MKKLLFALLLLPLASAQALQLSDAQFLAYAYSVGVDPFDGSGKAALTPSGESYALYRWTYPVPAPTEADLLPEAEAAEYVVAYRAAQAIAKEAARQAAKPAERKAFENRYYELVRQVLAAVDDPRKDEVPTPKLGFVLLGDLIRDYQAANPMGAVSLTLELLTVDAALKRYDAMWWDDAVEHEALPE